LETGYEANLLKRSHPNFHEFRRAFRPVPAFDLELLTSAFVIGAEEFLDLIESAPVRFQPTPYR
jgi:hypothetical protein